MARKPTSKSTKIDPNKIYRVTLKAPITIGRTLLRPRDRHRMRGIHVEAHKDAIETYEAL